jgi:hypothetical protein
MVAIQWSFLATLAGAASPYGNWSTGLLPHSTMKQLKGQLGEALVDCKIHKAGTVVKDSVDHESIMAPIRSQGYCGSCYVFAAVAVMESSAQVDLGKKVELSEQQSVDCAAEDWDVLHGGPSDLGGCGAGWPTVALKHYTASGVNDQNPAKCVCSRSSYPYLGDTLPDCRDSDYDKSKGDCWHEHPAHGPETREPILQTCQVQECECALPAGSVEDCYELPQKSKGHVAALKEALNHRPIAIAINADPISADEFTGGHYNKVVPAKMVECKGETSGSCCCGCGIRHRC